MSWVNIEDMEPVPGETWGELCSRWRELNRGLAPTRAPGIKIRKGFEGYHPSLADYPGDPRAYTDGRSDFNKKLDRKKAAGYEVASAADFYDEISRTELEIEKADLSIEGAYRAAAESGWNPPDGYEVGGGLNELGSDFERDLNSAGIESAGIDEELE